MSNTQIPLVDLKAGYELIEEQIRLAWDEALSGMRLFLGPNVQAFEKEFAAYCGVQHAIGVSDGTNALLLALRACEVQPGDEVITVGFTFIATTEAILLSGAKPVFVDIDPQTYTMDPNLIESQITSNTRVILPVHLYGQCADMDPIMEIAKNYNLLVIEDACQAHGAEYKGRKAGSIGHAAAFSFYFTKNLGAYGEGGMVTTNNDHIAKRVRMLRDHGSEKRYYHDLVGWNARLDELQAAALRIKLDYLNQWNQDRRNIALSYARRLESTGLTLPQEAQFNQHVYHLYVIRSSFREGLRNYLTEQGIGTGIHYPIPTHRQKAILDLGIIPTSLPHTESISEEILSLPMYPQLTEQQIENVCSAIKNYIFEFVSR